MFAISHLSIRGRSLLPLTAGLTVAQIIATAFIWRSNHHLFQAVSAVAAAGWLPIPAGPAATSLKSFGAAVWGGLFFTLTIGVGLSLATWAALFLGNWLLGLRRSGHRSLARIGPGLAIAWLSAALVLWLLAIFWMNANGLVPFPTLFTVCVPIATAAAALNFSPARAQPLWFAAPLVLVLLTGMFYGLLHPLDERLFIAIRDRLLLTNPIGMAVNDFYYRNTLYAAQTFKTFAQKEARACRITPTPEAEIDRRWTALLAKHDVLKVPIGPPVEVTVTASRDNLTLTSPRGKSVEVTSRAFMRDPGRWLRQFSEISDDYAPFRRLTFFGLLLGFPILLFVSVDGIVGRLAALFVSGPALTGVRSLICLAIGAMLLLPLWAGKPAQLQKEQIAAALADGAWPRRVAALRLIEKEKLEITGYPQYRELLTSPRLVERYYVARALAVSHNPESYDDLLTLIQDPQPNVVCQAYYALGERRDRRAVAAIKRQITQSDHWYAQWYGYRAMKRLGWRQTLSKSAP